VVAVVTLGVTKFFSSDVAVPVDDAVWGLVVLLFSVLTVLYGLFIRQDFVKGLFPTQIIAQGLLLCPLSLAQGARMLQWVGVTMAVCGAVVLVVIYYHARVGAPEHVRYVATPSELEALPLPCAITDREGNVISVSNILLQLARKTRPETEGKKITLLLPIDKEDVAMGGRTWKILQSPMEGDELYYFQLEEMRPTAVAAPPSWEESGFTDPETSLATRAYAERRVNEELYCVRRYGRGMSAAVLRMAFRGTDHQISKEDEIFKAYCRFVHASTRKADLSCLVGPRDIFVAMPETSLRNAEEVVGKLVDFVPPLQKELEGFDGAAEVEDSVAFFDASSGDLDFDQVLKKLDETLEA
jgi:hypothetical protein